MKQYPGLCTMSFEYIPSLARHLANRCSLPQTPLSLAEASYQK
jgi:hypothetical protein